MYYYMAIFSDDHIILGDEIRIDQLIRDYDSSHRATLVGVKSKISQKKYKLLKGFSPYQWLKYMQGDPMKDMSDGKHNLLDKMRKKELKRNIP